MYMQDEPASDETMYRLAKAGWASSPKHWNCLLSLFFLFVWIKTTHSSAHRRFIYLFVSTLLIYPRTFAYIHFYAALSTKWRPFSWIFVFKTLYGCWFSRNVDNLPASPMKNRSSVVSVMSKAIVGVVFDLNSALSFVYDTLQACSHIRISDMKVSDFIQNEIVLPVDAQYRHQFQQMQWQILQIGGAFTKIKCGLLPCVYDPRTSCTNHRGWVSTVFTIKPQGTRLNKGFRVLRKFSSSYT